MISKLGIQIVNYSLEVLVQSLESIDLNEGISLATFFLSYFKLFFNYLLPSVVQIFKFELMQTISLTVKFENKVSNEKQFKKHIKELQIFIVIYLREVPYIYDNINYIVHYINYINITNYIFIVIYHNIYSIYDYYKKYNFYIYNFILYKYNILQYI